jgi:exonuclease III
MKVISWNVNGAVDARARRQIDWLASQQPDVLLLQEASPRMLPETAESLGLTTCKGAEPFAGTRRRAVAVLTRLPVRGDWLTLSGTAFPNVALGRTVTVGHNEIELWSYHAPNGSTYGQQKVLHAHAMAERLRDRARPTIVGSDLNTPVVDPPDEASIRTHWETPRRLARGDPTDAVLCGAPGKRLHDLSDALRCAQQSLDASDSGSSRHGPLAVSYRTRRRTGEYRLWRFDIVWVSPEITVDAIRYATKETLETRLSDHAAVITSLRLAGG